VHMASVDVHSSQDQISSSVQQAERLTAKTRPIANGLLAFGFAKWGPLY